MTHAINRACAALVLLLATALAAQARIYSLRESGGGERVENALAPNWVLTQTVKVNGAKGKLRVGYAGGSMHKTLAELARVLPDYRKGRNERAILIDIPADDQLERWFVLNLRQGSAFTIFHLTIPRAGLDNNAADYWPDDLPQPVGCRIDQVMQLQERGGVYATFSRGGKGAGLYDNYDQALQAQGWQRTSHSRNGGVYLHAERSALLTFSVIPGEQRTHAAVYQCPITSR